jgi:hypothetical protein
MLLRGVLDYLVLFGGMGEWLNPSDCKSDALGLRGFESLSLHQFEYYDGLEPT